MVETLVAWLPCTWGLLRCHERNVTCYRSLLRELAGPAAQAAVLRPPLHFQLTPQGFRRYRSAHRRAFRPPDARPTASRLPKPFQLGRMTMSFGLLGLGETSSFRQFVVSKRVGHIPFGPAREWGQRNGRVLDPELWHPSRGRPRSGRDVRPVARIDIAGSIARSVRGHNVNEENLESIDAEETKPFHPIPGFHCNDVLPCRRQRRRDGRRD